MIREFFQAQEGKAFPYATQLTDAGGPLLSGGGPEAYNAYNGFNYAPNVANRTPLSQRHAQKHMQTYGGHEAIDWLYLGANFTANSVAAAAWHFEDAKGNELAAKITPASPAGTKTAPDAVVNLFQQPNPYQSWEELMELTVIDWLLVGNAYWVKWRPTSDGAPIAIYRMAPQFVHIVPGQFGPDSYNYRLPGQNQDTTFSPDQVVHFKRPNPNDMYYGMGIVQAAATPLDMEIGLTQTGNSYYQRAALPSGVVQSDRRVPRDVFNKLKRQMAAFYSGSQNAGQLMVLEAGLNYKTVSPSAAEAALLTMGQWSRDRVFALFNMNKSLVGIWDQGDNPNIALWQSLFDQKTGMPIANRFANLISRKITQPAYSLDFCIDYTETQQPDDVVNRAGAVAKLPGVKVREVRAAAGLSESTGDKDIDEMVLNLPGQNLDANGQGGFPDPNLPGEPGRPPIPENTRGFGRGSNAQPPKQPPAVAGGNAGKVAGKSIQDFPTDAPLEEKLEFLEELVAQAEDRKALPAATHTHVGELSGSHVTPPEDILIKTRTSEIDGISAAVTSELFQAAHELERGLMDSAEGKAADTIYQRIKQSAAWDKFKSRIEAAMTTAAQQAMSAANSHHAKNGFDPADLNYEDEAQSIVHDPNMGVNAVVKNFQKKILAAVLGQQQKGSPHADIVTEIQQAVSTWQNDNAKQIGLNTGTLAYNHGTIEIADTNGMTHVLVSDGEDFDEPCIEANGDTWTLDKARKNLQEHSRCRRAFVPVASDA